MLTLEKLKRFRIQKKTCASEQFLPIKKLKVDENVGKILTIWNIDYWTMRVGFYENWFLPYSQTNRSYHEG